MVMKLDTPLPPRQRSPRTDPDLRDGDSGHGNPGEPAGDRNAVDSDTDTGDTDGREDGLRGASPERQEEFENLVEEFEGEGRYPGREEEVAARIVNKQRRAFGETKEQEAERAVGNAPDVDLPIREYQRLTVPEVVRLAGDLDADGLSRVLSFEKTHRNRKTLVARLQRLADGQN